MLGKSFRPAASYRDAESQGYKLLPIRFTHLEGGRYAVTNLVGEYRVLDRPTLQQLVGKQLPAGSELYDDLKSAHFLYDTDSTIAPELLGLKYRTKISNLSQFTSLHMFVVTLRCDYTCQYCQVSRQTEDREAFDMSEATALASVDVVFRSPARFLKIEFQGGEPLLNFGRIKQVVRAVQDRNAVEKREVQFVITSNLSLVTDEILDWCSRNGVLFSTSLDGPADLHNKNRPRPGRNGYQLTVQGIERVRARLGLDSVSALMTTTEASLGRVREIIDEYVAQGLHSIFLRPLSPYGFAARAGHIAKYDAERWLGFYKEGLEYILEINKQGYPLVETYSAIVLRKMLTPQNPGYVDLQSPAGLGISAILYNYDGDVYAGDEARMLAEMSDKTFRLGSVLTDSYEDMLLSDALLDPLEASVIQGIPQCTDCAFLPYCGTDPVYHHATQGDPVGLRPTSGYCHRNMGVFKHLIARLEANDEHCDTLQRWAWQC